MPVSVWNCLWGHALKISPGINRKSRVSYPGPGFLSSATWPSLPKKHYNGLITKSPSVRPWRRLQFLWAGYTNNYVAYLDWSNLENILNFHGQCYWGFYKEFWHLGPCGHLIVRSMWTLYHANTLSGWLQTLVWYRYHKKILDHIEYGHSTNINLTARMFESLYDYSVYC